MPAHRGEKHHLAKLTPELVREMRELRKGGATLPVIQEWLLVERDVDVTHGVVWSAVVGRTWAHVA